MKEMIKYGKKILKTLNDSGYEAYFVGGFVRDEILNIESNDIDIATSAWPSQVESLFENTAATGKKYGTITVFMNDYAYEVTTFRFDKSYKNYRQPESVDFSKKLEDDLIRRDFTINALAKDIEGQTIDLFNGMEDIKQRQIKAIDDPNKRFKEDALRILRAIRFVGKLNFHIEKNTFDAMKKDSHLLSKIPTERIIKELDLILKQPYKEQIYHLFNDLHLGDVFSDLDRAIKKLNLTDYPISLEQFFALGLYPDKNLSPDEWRFSKSQMSRIETIKELMNILLKQRITSIHLYNYSKDLMLAANDLLVKFFDYEDQEDKIINLDRHLKIRSFKDLKITGHDILPLVKDEKNVGKIIETLIEDVLLGKVENRKEDLHSFASRLAEDLNEEN
ncbi:CCA tRNA nucleotidyltransferase [Mycoplasmatota bacterium]|nr:CCA tRNA nucleotidyltransferase [Mycoplasmatota bacterium]